MAIDAILCSCLLAVLLSHATFRRFFASRLNSATWLALLALQAANLGAEWIWHEQWAEAARILQAVLLPLLVVGTVTSPNTVVGRALEWFPLRWMGRLSYSFYLWQELFCANTRGTLAGRLYMFPVWFALSLGCACVSYYCLERLLIRLGHRLSNRVVPESQTKERTGLGAFTLSAAAPEVGLRVAPGE